MDADFDPYVCLEQGDRSAAKVEVKVSHDLGDRTLVVVILLAIVIGACGVVMGLNLSRQAQLEDQATILAAKLHTTINQNARIEAALQEKENARIR